jgi:predicted transporter
LCIEESLSILIVRNSFFGGNLKPNKEHLKEFSTKVNSKLKFINLQQLGGVVLFIIGAILIFFSIHAMKKISEAKGLTQDVSNFFQHNSTWNPIIRFFGGKAQEKISESYVPATAVMIVGIFLVIVGVIIFMYYRIRKSNTKG